MMLQEILNQGQGHAVDAAKNFAFDQVISSGRALSVQFLMGNWSHSGRKEANGSNALGRNRIHDEYSRQD